MQDIDTLDSANLHHSDILNNRVSCLIVDEKTGEVINKLFEPIKLDDSITLGGKFFKIFERSYNHISDKHIGKFLKIIGKYMQKDQTLMLSDPLTYELIKLRLRDITEFLGCNSSTTTRMMHNLYSVHAIFKIDGYLIVNPTFANKNRYFSTKYLKRMIEIDSGMFNYLPRKIKEQFHKIKKYVPTN